MSKGVKQKGQEKQPQHPWTLTDEQVDDLAPILRRIYILLSDGKEHSREEIWTCIDDDHAPIHYIYQHITRLRQILEGYGIELSGKNPVRYSLTPK